MKTMKDVWEFLNGKKTVIGAALMIILKGVEAIWPGVIPDNVYRWIEDVIITFTGIGLTHKLIKNGKHNKDAGNPSESGQ